MHLWNRFIKRYLPTSDNSAKILVCGLGLNFQETIVSDSEIYSRYYRSVTTLVTDSTEELCQSIGDGCDIVHLCCEVSADGRVISERGSVLSGGQLIDHCCLHQVKLLWVASDNSTDSYVHGFRAHAKKLNLVMTLERNGSRFPAFLDRLLYKLSSGQTMPKAWLGVTQTSSALLQSDLPSTIFYAGRPRSRFQS